MKLKLSILFWEKRLRRIEGRKESLRVENVRRNLQLLKEAEGHERNRN